MFKEFKSLISKNLDKKGKYFNKQVFKWFDDNLKTSRKLDYELKSNMDIDKLAKVEPKLGDIDVLLLDYDNRRLFSIECKNIESAKNPRDINHEVDKFFDNKHWIEKHQKRDNWIKNNLNKLSKKIKHDLKNYTVFSIFIVSQELPTIYLKKLPIDVLPFPQIKRDGLNFLDKYH